MVQEKFPDEVIKAQKHPYTHRYPRAEVGICGILLNVDFGVLTVHYSHIMI
jgi:hypothetical protein